ncbi:MAG: GPW/gp25 family protein [Phormidesmis sp.]
MNISQQQKTKNIAYPLHIDGRGRIAGASHAEHIRQLIEQLLFTSPGERVNRPEFGSGIQQMIFSPNSDELAAATQFLVQGSLEQWLGELIQVEAVTVSARDGELVVAVRYMIRRTQERRNDSFSPAANGNRGAGGIEP